MFSAWNEDVHVVWIIILWLFFLTFSALWTWSLVYMKCYQSVYSGYLVGATPVTVFFWLFLNFAYVFCTEWRSACGLGIILWLCFLTFFCFVNLVFFVWNAIKVYRQWVPCGRNFSYSYFADVFFMKWRCACDFGIITGLCFLTFSALWT